MTHSSVGSSRRVLLVEHDLLVLASEPAEAIFLCVADRQQIARHLADPVDVAALAGLLRPQAALGAGLDEELLDHLGHQPPFFGLGTLADDGREVQFPLGQPFQSRFGDRPKPLGADVATMRSSILCTSVCRAYISRSMRSSWLAGKTSPTTSNT